MGRKKADDIWEPLKRLNKAFREIERELELQEDSSGNYVRILQGGGVAHIPASTNWNLCGSTLCGLRYDLNDGWTRVSGGRICRRCERSHCQYWLLPFLQTCSKRPIRGLSPEVRGMGIDIKQTPLWNDRALVSKFVIGWFCVQKCLAAWKLQQLSLISSPVPSISPTPFSPIQTAIYPNPTSHKLPLPLLPLLDQSCVLNCVEQGDSEGDYM